MSDSIMGQTADLLGIAEDQLTRATAAVFREMRDAELSGLVIPVNMGPLTVYWLVLALQVATRYNDVNESTRAEWERIGRALTGCFASLPRKILDLGWDRSLDVDVESDDGKSEG